MTRTRSFVTAIVTLLALLVPGLAHAIPSARAVVTPHTVNTGQLSTPCTYQITNNGTENIKSVQIIVPAGFSFVSIDRIIVTNGRAWTGFHFGGVITLTAASTADNLRPGESLQVALGIATQSSDQGALPWPANVTGTTNEESAVTEAVAGDMNMRIVRLAGTSAVTPHVVDDGQVSISFTYSAANTGVDSVKQVCIALPPAFSNPAIGGAITVSGSKHWSGSVSGNEVRLTANSASDYIATGQSLQLVINAGTLSGSAPDTVWVSSMTGSYNGVIMTGDAVAGDREVDVLTLEARGRATPHRVYAGQSNVAITYRVTNAGEDQVKRAQITIPSGFAFVGVGGISASGAKSWSSSQAGGVITLTPSAPADYLANGEYVDVIINAATQATAQIPTAWQCRVTGNYNGTKQCTAAAAGDLQVEILTLQAEAVATQHQVYSASLSSVTYKVTNTGTESLRKIDITVPAGFTFDHSATVVCPGKVWNVSFSGGKLTLTANSTDDYLQIGQSLQVDIYANTQASAQDPVTWPAGITGSNDGTGNCVETNSGDMKVEIVTMVGYGLAQPHFVGANEAAIDITYRITSTGTERFKRAVITIPGGFTYSSIQGVTAANAKSWSASYAAGQVILTPASAANYIDQNEYVEVVVRVQTGASRAPAAWQAVVTGENNLPQLAAEAAVGDQNVEICDLLGYGLISPRIVDTAQNTLFTYRITNKDGHAIRAATINVPAGFVFTAINGVTASGGKTWTASNSGSQLNLSAAGAGSYLNNNEYVELTFRADSQAAAQPAVPWTGTLTGSAGDTRSIIENAAGDSAVEIRGLSATAAASPNIVSGGQASVGITYRVNNTGADSIRRVQVVIPSGFTFVSADAPAASGGKAWSISQAGGVVTMTATGAGDPISTGQYVQAVIHVATQSGSQPPVVWAGTCTGACDGTAAAADVSTGSRSVEIKLLDAKGLVTPHIVNGGQSVQPITYNVTNQGADRLRLIRITIPSGFTYSSLGTVSASGGKAWTAAYASGILTLTPASAAAYLDNNEHVEVMINVATQNADQAAVAWSATGDFESGGTKSILEESVGDMKVEIRSLRASALASPRIVDGSQTAQPLSYRVTNTGTDDLALVTISVPTGFTFVSPVSVTASAGKTWTSSYDSFNRKVTLIPSSPLDTVANGQYVQLDFRAQTQDASQAPITWSSIVTGVYNGTAVSSETVVNDMRVEIRRLAGTATATPHLVVAGVPADITYRVTNTGLDSAQRAEITIPAQFTYTSLGAVTVSAGKHWTAAFSGGKIVLTATAAADHINPGEYAEVIIRVTPTNTDTAPITWPCVMTGTWNGTVSLTEAVAGDMQVDINTLIANAVVTPHRVDGSQTAQAIVYRITNGGTDRLNKIRITIPSGFTYASIASVTASSLKSWSASYAGGIVTLSTANPTSSIANGEYVEVTLRVGTQAAALPPTMWFASATGEASITGSATEATAGDMRVEIVPLSATAVITPHEVDSGQSAASLNCLIRNTNTDTLRRIRVRVPSGFTAGTVTGVVASGGKSWTPSVAGTDIILTANSVADYIATGETVRVTFNVATQNAAQAATAFPCQVTGSLDGVYNATEEVVNDLRVAIVLLAATATATPHYVYDNNVSVPITYRMTNAGQDPITRVVITVPTGFTYSALGTLTVSGGKHWSSAVSGNTITLTATTNIDRLAPGEYIQAVVVTNTGAPQGAVNWTSTVTGYLGGAVQSGDVVVGDRAVSIMGLTANAVITPHTVLAGQSSVGLTYRITNTGSERLKKVSITVPTGFTFVSALSPTTSNGRSWTPSVLGTNLTMTANSASDYLPTGQYLQIILYAATQDNYLPPTTWPCQMTGENNGVSSATEAVAGDMQVKIIQLGSTAEVTPHMVDGGQPTVQMTYRINNINSTTLKVTTITIPSGFTYVSLGPTTLSNPARHWTASYSGGKVFLRANSAADNLGSSEYLQQTIVVQTQGAPAGPITWPSDVVDENDVETQCIEGQPDDMKTWIYSLAATARATPHKLHAARNNRLVTYYITGTGTDQLKEARITIPPGFTFASMGQVNVSSTKVWHGAFSGGVVTLTADSSEDYLATGEIIDAGIYVNTQATNLAAQTWPCSVTGRYDGITPATTTVTGDMDVEIVTLQSTGTITPRQVYSGQANQPFTFRATNTDTDDIDLVEITVPGGFGFVSTDSVAASAGKQWTAAFSRGKITLSPVSAADALARGQYVELQFFATTRGSAQAATAWPVQATGVSGSTVTVQEAESGALKVEIMTLVATGLVTPHQVYVNQTNQQIIYRVTNGGTDRLKVVKLAIPTGFTYNSHMAPTASGGKSWLANQVNGQITITPVNAANDLDVNEFVQITLNVQTAAAVQSPVSWTAYVTGENNVELPAAEQNPGDCRVEIVDITAHAKVLPKQVDNGQISQNVLSIVTNRNVEKLHQVRVRIPSGFTYQGMGAITVTGGKIWNASYAAPLVTLSANTSNDDLATNETVQAVIRVGTQVTPLTGAMWATTVIGVNGGIGIAQEAVPGDLAMDIVRMTATARVTPHTIYNATINQLVNYEVTLATGTSPVKKAEITVPSGFTFASLGAVTASGGKKWNASFDAGVITLLPETESDYIVFGEKVNVACRVNTQQTKQPPVQWTCRVTNANDAAAMAVQAANGDMYVEIVGFTVYGTVAPSKVTAAQTNMPITVRLVNRNTETLRSARVTVPSGFTLVGISSVTVSGDKNWSCVTDGDGIRLTAQSSADYLGEDEHIQVVLSVNTANASLPPVRWLAQAQGSIGGTIDVLEQSQGSMETEILLLGATVDVSTHTVYVNTASQQVGCTVTNTKDDRVGAIRVLVPEIFSYLSPDSISVPSGKQWICSQSNNIITLTAVGTADYLGSGEKIQVKFNINIGNRPAKGVIWNATVAGESNAVVLCQETWQDAARMEVIGYRLSLAASPTVVVPGGETALTAHLIDAQGNVQADATVSFRIVSGAARFAGGNTVMTDGAGNAQGRIKIDAAGTIVVEGWYGTHTTSSVTISALDIEPVLRKPRFSYVRNKVLCLKESKSLLEFESVAGLSVQYRIDDGPWLTYAQAFAIPATGSHTLSYRYADANGFAGRTFSVTVYASRSDGTNKVSSYPNPFAAGRQTAYIEYYLDDDADVTLDIYDLFGQKVWQKRISAGEQGGQRDLNQVAWKGVNDAGEVIASGGYILRVSVNGSVRWTRKIAVVK